MSEDPRNGSPDDPRNRRLGVEAQHIFVSEIARNDTAAKGFALLQSINFNLESRSNKVVLLARPNVRDAILNAPDAIQEVFIDGITVTGAKTPKLTLIARPTSPSGPSVRAGRQ